LEKFKERANYCFLQKRNRSGHAKMILEQNGFKTSLMAAHGKT
jgi:hypothetical protein